MTKIEKHQEICVELNKIYEAKNADYGDSFGKGYKEYGPMMAVIRLEDKLNRFKALIKSESQVKDESIIDTLKDLSNYSIMTILELDDEKLAEVKCSACGGSGHYSDGKCGACNGTGREIEDERD